MLLCAALPAIAGAPPIRYLLAMTHDKILIVDFGSQVTQLIARRVREEGVYCEIVPFNKAADAFAEMKPRGVILSGGPASMTEARLAARAAGDLRGRRAGARHLLRRAGDGGAARRRRSRAGITASSAAPRSRW